MFGYMKKLIVDGNGKFEVIRIEAEGEEGLHIKHDEYQGADWADATEEEYEAAMKAVEVPVEPEVVA